MNKLTREVVKRGVDVWADGGFESKLDAGGSTTGWSGPRWGQGDGEYTKKKAAEFKKNPDADNRDIFIIHRNKHFYSFNSTRYLSGGSLVEALDDAVDAGDHAAFVEHTGELWIYEPSRSSGRLLGKRGD